MTKRPLCAAAVLFVLIQLLLAGGFGLYVRPSPLAAECSDKGVFVSAKGTVYRKEKNKKGQSFYLKDCKILLEDQIYDESKILVRLETNNHILLGNRISVQGKAKTFQPARNQGNFDGRDYYQRQGLSVTVTAKRFKIIDDKVFYVREKLSAMRNVLSERLVFLLGEEYGGIMGAIMLGDKSGLSHEIKELYQKSGIGHILAISGLHMSFLGFAFYKRLRKMGFGFKSAGTAGILFLLGFAVMTGGSVSSLRALIMFSIRMGAEMSGREYDMMTSLSSAAVTLTATRPLCLFDAGFLLSFGAILSIGILYPCIQYLITGGKNKHKISDMFICSLSINLMLLPVILFFYFEIPPYSVILNLVVIPLMPPALGFGVFGVLFSFILPGAGKFMLFICKTILFLYKYLCRFTMSLPFGRIVTGKPAFSGIVVYYVVLFVFCVIIFHAKEHKWKLYKGRVALSFFALLCPVIVSACVLPYNNAGRLTVTMADVGQGDGIFLKGPKGHTYFIDGGSSDVSKVGSGRIEPFLKSVGIGTLDYVLISHGDEDHRNGIEELLANQKMRIKIKNLLLPPKKVWDGGLEKLADLAKASGTKVLFFKEGDVLTEGGFSITCFGPAENYRGPAGNEASMTALAKYGEFSMLFTGDLEGEGEKELEDSGKLCPVQVLKVAHHGSKNSTSEYFLSRTRPRLALISSGINNRHGHPHTETLERLKKAGSKVYRTQLNGAITIKTDGKEMEIETFL